MYDDAMTAGRFLMRAMVSLAVVATVVILAHPQDQPLVVGSATATVISRQRDSPVAGALSARNANYEIDVRLDHSRHTFTGTEIIRWRNIGHAPADSLRMHLYWNGWYSNQSSWM